jgi:hypothetical protein
MGKTDFEFRGLVAISWRSLCCSRRRSQFQLHFAVHKQVFPSCNFDSIVAWSGREIQQISRHNSLFDINLIQGRVNSLDPYSVSCHISFELQLII